MFYKLLFIFSWIFITFFINPLKVYGEAETEIQKLALKAQSLENQGKFDESIALYQKAAVLGDTPSLHKVCNKFLNQFFGYYRLSEDKSLTEKSVLVKDTYIWCNIYFKVTDSYSQKLLNFMESMSESNMVKFKMDEFIEIVNKSDVKIDRPEFDSHINYAVSKIKNRN